MKLWQKVFLGVLVCLVPVLGFLIWRMLYMLLSDDPAIWAKAIAQFKRQDHLDPPPQKAIVFIGSSSFAFWETLPQDMAPLPVINRGFGGSRINQVVHYADQIVTPYYPRIVVLFAGTNDIAWPRPKTAQAVFDGYVNFVQTIHAALPQTPIYYIAITPTPARWKYWSIAQEANKRIRAYTQANKHLHFIDLTNELLGSDGKPDKSLFRIDKLHPNEAGYAVWTRMIKPHLEAELNKPFS